jgi:hypothetical protein
VPLRLSSLALCLLAAAAAAVHLPPAPASDKDDVAPPDWAPPKKPDVRILLRQKPRTALLAVTTPEDGRPFIHPLRAPDGKGGDLTELSPDHHKHQTGLYVGFVKVNGRDFFHNRGKDHFRGPALNSFGSSREGDPRAEWVVKYDLLDGQGKAMLEERQWWTIRDRETHLLLDLDLTLTAAGKDVTLGKHDYGGLFLRMPWRQKTGGKAVNSEGDENAKAEGKRARWVDVGMPIEGRKDWGHVAVLDHKDNPRHPVAWRVDGQFGVGPAFTRSADFVLKKGEKLDLRYRLVVYTGELDTKRIEAAWKGFTDRKK